MIGLLGGSAGLSSDGAGQSVGPGIPKGQPVGAASHPRVANAAPYWLTCGQKVAVLVANKVMVPRLNFVAM